MVLRNISLLLLVAALTMSLINPSLPDWGEDTPVQEVLSYLGQDKPKHNISIAEEEEMVWIKRGEDIIKRGKTVGPDGNKSSYVSKHYVCTSCHNLKQEDPSLKISDPESRLEYAIANRLPFLQATTFRGIVNRETWYNDDYFKKYGDLVKPARESLEAAVQLCAVECAQGRPVEDWEMKAIMAYYWSLQFKLGDLEMSNDEIRKLKQLAGSAQTQPEAMSFLKGFYLQKSPATFGEPPSNKSTGYGLTGDVERGKAIYALSCLHCHKEGGVSRYTLDQGRLSLRHLRKKIPKNSHMSLYEIIRHGTYALPGHRPYMPHYPRERMSDQQVEDLRAYIEIGAK